MAAHPLRPAASRRAAIAVPLVLLGTALAFYFGVILNHLPS